MKTNTYFDVIKNEHEDKTEVPVSAHALGRDFISLSNAKVHN